MVIELRVVQFWSEIILVISNRTRAVRSFDFDITRMISDQIALHSVQLPLYIASPARTLFSLKLSMCYYVVVLRWAGPLVEILLRATKISPCQIIKLQCHFRHEPRL